MFMKKEEFVQDVAILLICMAVVYCFRTYVMGI